MLQFCCHSTQGTSTTWIFPIVISLMGLIVAYYSWLANTKPVLIFYLNSETRMTKIKNVGKGPAMNLVISYVVNGQEANNWVNPVRCYSIQAGGVLNLNWFVHAENRSLMYKKHGDGNKSEDEDKFFIVTNNKEVGKKSKADVAKQFADGKIYTYGHGVFKYGVTYSSAFGWKSRYTSIIEDDITQIFSGYDRMPNWDKKNIVRLWQTVKKGDLPKKT